jgi:hypothetical protein
MQSAAALIASIFVPVAVAFVGNGYANAMKDSENKLKYVELAIGILRAEPTRETLPLRGWAVEVLSSQSMVPISEEVKKQLKALPLKSLYFPYMKAPLDPEVAEFFRQAASGPRSASSSPAASAPSK